MKKHNLIQFVFFCFILFSCHSKPEIKEQPRVEYTIQNYKLDDDELARRKTEATKADKPIKEKKLSTSKRRIVTN
ncbi:hypothetical protein SAMN05443549_10948 [Flavobacterium fluvii]|uniref:Lipoprotein n=1 Tax=Flavobacterium fluvii TaxID=468056 RepID=A0A1M5P303_9FLAO|nr:hypothetical protein [Flavobacterium fluvii]SHG96152.1 hypothetical protein SAMN05443549_10948 [Flavobacterium fluvii]